jgi:hypothetical protein
LANKETFRREGPQYRDWLNAIPRRALKRPTGHTPSQASRDTGGTNISDWAINARMDVGPPKNHVPVTTHNPFNNDPYELVEQTSRKSNDNLNRHNIAISKQVHKSDNTSFAGATCQRLPEDFTILDQLSPMMGNVTYAHTQKKISWDNPNGPSSPTKVRSVL